MYFPLEANSITQLVLIDPNIQRDVRKVASGAQRRPLWFEDGDGKRWESVCVCLGGGAVWSWDEKIQRVKYRGLAS